jgi:ABC-type antimicrobial peptide transport system, permease component
MMVDMLHMSVKNLLRQKSRSRFTILGIAIGVASVVVISSISQIGGHAIHTELESLGLVNGLIISSNKKVAGAELGEAHLEIVRTSGSVDSAIPIIMDYTKTFMRELMMDAVIWGIDYGANQIITLHPLHGRLITKNDVLAGKKICVVDQKVAQAYYKRDNIVGKTISLQFSSQKEDFEVVGVVESGGDLMQGLMGNFIPSFVYVPYTTLQYSTGKGGFDQIAVQVKAGIDADIAGGQLISSISGASGLAGGYQFENMRKQQQKLNRILDLVTLALSLVAGVSLVVSGLGIMTMMLVSVHERTREIGIKKSIGASRQNIQAEFMAEAVVLSLIGSCTGSLGGILLVGIAGALLKMQVLFHTKMIAATVLISVLIGVVFSAYPASVAAQLKPVDALRYE